MQVNIGFISYLLPAVAFLFLTALLLVSWRGRTSATLVVLASVSSTVWAALAATQQLALNVPGSLIILAEFLRTGMWCLFLYTLVAKGDVSRAIPARHAPWIVAGLAIGLLFGLRPVLQQLGFPARLAQDVTLLVWVGFAIGGLLLVEQLYRNAQPDDRWTLKYMCMGLGAVFAYDFYMYSDALLVKQIDARLWAARGYINALIVPLLAISVARNPGWNLHIHVSRHVVYHSITLMGAGLYLILMAVSGFLIRYYGGAWGGVVQVIFLCLAGALLLVLLFSDRIRAQLRVLLSKHFFSYKYDYREEWSRFTDDLSSTDASVPHKIIVALAKIVHCTSGVLWLRQDKGFELLESWNRPPLTVPDAELNALADFAEAKRWVIDLEEYRNSPAMYEGLTTFPGLLKLPDASLLIPLFFGEKVLGMVLLGKSDVSQTMNWEDHDLLKVAGRQAASELAQFQINRELVQARQFEAFNRLSAYVVHDLKNILAQQSLIVSNAEKHKHNPAFVDDVISTVENSVGRMTRLMEQMRSGLRGARTHEIILNDVLEEVVQRHSAREPCPQLDSDGRSVTVPADKEQLATVFGHIIQNAQDAAGKKGRVEVSLSCTDSMDAVVSVRDDGVGMDEAFIRERLFRPFDSTKGLTGMGVGAFESREYVRSIGGDIEVSSTPGEGSLFRIVIPCQMEIAGD